MVSFAGDKNPEFALGQEPMNINVENVMGELLDYGGYFHEDEPIAPTVADGQQQQNAGDALFRLWNKKSIALNGLMGLCKMYRARLQTTKRGSSSRPCGIKGTRRVCTSSSNSTGSTRSPRSIVGTMGSGKLQTFISFPKL